MKKLVFFIVMCAAAFGGGAHAQSVSLDTLYSRDSVYFLLRLTGYNNPWVAVLSIEQPFCTTCLFASPYNEEFYILLADSDNTGVYNYYTAGIRNPFTVFDLTLHFDSSKGIAVGSGTYSDSTLVEIAAIPIAGNRFVNWSDGITENPRYLLVAADISLTANFEPNDNTAVSTAEADGISIMSSGHDITLEGCTGDRIRIFDTGGRLIAETTCHGTCTLRLPATGIYLVQVGNHPAHKVVIN